MRVSSGNMEQPLVQSCKMLKQQSRLRALTVSGSAAERVTIHFGLTLRGSALPSARDGLHRQAKAHRSVVQPRHKRARAAAETVATYQTVSMLVPRRARCLNNCSSSWRGWPIFHTTREFKESYEELPAEVGALRDAAVAAGVPPPLPSARSSATRSGSRTAASPRARTRGAAPSWTARPPCGREGS